MPPVGQRLGALQRRLDGRSLARVARGLSVNPVTLGLPRFHVNTNVELTESLEKLGMPTAFSEAADFSSILAGASLKIKLVEHAVNFTVDEKGTVAAAATVVVIGKKARPKRAEETTFNANRPFLFFLRDNRTGAVLFAGRVTNPIWSAP
jgi:serpin B